MANERNIEAIEAGRQAVAMSGAIRSFVDERMRDHVQGLINMYRAGAVRPLDHDQLVGKVAEITALSDLLSDLESVARRGEVAANREFGDGKTS